MTRWIAMLSMTVLLVGGACSSGGDGSAAAAAGSSSGDSAEAPFEVAGEPVATTDVNMPKSYKFEPAVISVDAGEEVTWTNDDDFPHNVHLLDGSDLTEDVPVGESATLTFDETGEIYYECSLHPQQMRGKIIVE